MQYTYCFANASLVLRLMTYLSRQFPAELTAVTVIHLVDRWIVRIKIQTQPSARLAGNFRSFLQENGYLFELSEDGKCALQALDAGQTVSEVVAQYQMVIVSHGGLHPEDVESFRKTFSSELGYCPPSLV